MEEDDSNEDLQSRPGTTEHTSSTQQDSSSSGEGNSNNQNLKSTPTPGPSEIETLTAQLDQYKKELEDKDDSITELREHILSLETDWTTDWNNKKRKFSNSKPEEDEDQKLQILRNENQELKKRINDLLANKDVPYAESSNLNIHSEPKVIKSMQTDRQMGQLIETIEGKISKGFESIQANVEEMIKSKLNNLHRRVPHNNGVMSKQLETQIPE